MLHFAVQILGMNDKRDRLAEQLTNAFIIKDKSVRKLLHLIEAKSEK